MRFVANDTSPPQAEKQDPVAKYDSIELHVLHSHLAGMLYDFMGWLTSRRTRLCLSDSDNASPAVDAIVDFAKMRGLRLEDAQVKDWQAILTTPAPPRKEWVGLTELEVKHYNNRLSGSNVAQEIESKLRERNT
jgi:hypothetical protein